AGANGRGLDATACRKINVSQRVIPSGESIEIELEIICVIFLEDNQYFVIETFAPDCDGLSIQQGVRLERLDED
ncbi:MAG: hypothetical protein AAGM67_09295, partial [Bacteroidota bacterium]